MKRTSPNTFLRGLSTPTSVTYSSGTGLLSYWTQTVASGLLTPPPTIYLFLLVATLWAGLTGQVWGQTISTVTGNGSSGFNGDGVAATSASLSNPSGVAMDAAGNSFIADQLNNRIRKVTASTGLISTVAGNGTDGFDGDGADATLASLSTPTGVAVDRAGNLYIADLGNQRIRKVTASTGFISTIAGNGTAGSDGDGGAATLAELGNPTGVALDAAGNIYIADQSNSRVRKITISTGLISTVAGNGSYGSDGDGADATLARLSNPTGVAVDAAGMIYIVDQGNQRIRKVTASTGFISTVAGNGTPGFSGDGADAISASLGYPGGVALDAAGNIYIAELLNQRVRKVTVSTGIISTVAGNGTYGFDGDGGAATSAKLGAPSGVAVDASGSIYIADQGNNRIRKVTIIAPNTPPTVVAAIPSQTAFVGQAFSYTVSASTFTDAETPNALTLSVSGLPAGLIFTAPATISGTPTTASGSPFSLTITATDPGSLSVTTTLTLTIQPEIPGGADLTPMLNLPQGNFTASGSESIHNLTMTISELAGKATGGLIVLTLTAPLGYSLGFDAAQTSISVTGSTTDPVSTNNANWEVRASSVLQLTLVSKTGQGIGASGASVIGLSLTRSSAASVGSANLTVNVNDDATSGYDSNPTNNIFVRILNAL